MEKHLTSLRADVSAPERIKFTAPLVFLHSLWSGSWMWQEVTGAMSQRGWECWALDLRGRPGSRSVATMGTIQLEEYNEDVVTAAQSLWAPPVVCGHGLGALLALLTAEHLKPRALILLAPLLPRTWDAHIHPPLPLANLSAVPALLWSRPLRPPRWTIARDFLFNTLPLALQTRLHEQLQPDSGTVARALTRGQVPAPSPNLGCPLLIVRGSEDRMSHPAAIDWLTARFQADSREYRHQGHWLTISGQASQLVADLHRWLIHRLGESLLMPQEEEE
jgi:pimeloyl-ACP methyl ester carboxylesterase